MNFAIFMMLVLIVLLLAGVFPGNGIIEKEFFHSPVIIICFAVIALLLLVCWPKKQRPFFWKLGFRLMHLGGTVALIGCAITFFWGQKYSFAMFLSRGSRIVMIDQIPARMHFEREKKPLPLPFKMAVKNFVVKKYPPESYTLYRYNPKSAYFEVAKDSSGKELVFKLKECGNELDLGSKFGKLPVTRLQQADGSWVMQYDLDDENFLHSAVMMPRYYGCDILLAPKSAEKAEEAISRRMEINNPAVYNDWRICLMGYDRSQERVPGGVVNYVNLVMRKDPGRLPAYFGFWMLMVGSFIWAFSGDWKQKRREKKSIETAAAKEGGA